MNVREYVNMGNVQRYNFSRPNHLSPDLIILDGISGTGKTMVMRFLDSISGVGPAYFDSGFEQMTIGAYLGEIRTDFLRAMLSLHVDQRYYDQAISREINLRVSDLSSIWRSKKRWRYLSQLFMSDRNLRTVGGTHELTTLFVIVHQLLDSTLNLDYTYDGQIKRILCVRHPYYLYDHWLSYVNNFGTNPRELTLTFGKHGAPWFLSSEYSNFARFSNMEKAVICISNLFERQDALLAECEDLFVVDFERFVLGPRDYLSGIESFLGKKMNSIPSNLRKECLPRAHINASRNLPIYRKYGADKLKTNLSHQDDFAARRDKIMQSVSKKTFKQLESAAHSYESRFGLWF